MKNIKTSDRGARRFANGFSARAVGCFTTPVRQMDGIDTKKALATSIAVILPLSAVSLFVYYPKSGVGITSVLPLMLGGLAGGIAAGKLFHKTRAALLRRILGLLIIYGGIKALLQ